MPKAKKVSKLSCEFNEAQDRGHTITTALIQELVYGTDVSEFEEGDINTRYEVTVTVRELGDWDKT